MRNPKFRPFLEHMETRLVPSTLDLHAGGDLQAAINNAQPGDTHHSRRRGNLFRHHYLAQQEW